MQEPKTFFHHEQPIDVTASSASVATDYVKRPHVFRLKLATGGDYLFQCKDDVSKYFESLFNPYPADNDYCRF